MASLRSERGTTVIELSLVAGLLVVILGGVLSVYESGMRVEKEAEVRGVALEDMRFAMARVTKDMRQAISISASSTTSRLEMQTLVNGANHRVVYELVGGELRRGAAAGTSAPSTTTAILKRVVNDKPFCYDPPDCTDLAPEPGLDMIRLQVHSKPASNTARKLEMATDISLRNNPPVR